MTNQSTICLFDTPESHENLLPLSFTRPVPDIRIGIDTIREKWNRLTSNPVRCLPVDYLRKKFGPLPENGETFIFVAGNIVPDRKFVEKTLSLNPGEALTDPEGRTLAAAGNIKLFLSGNWKSRQIDEIPLSINYPFDIFLNNGRQIEADFRELLPPTPSAEPEPSTTILGPRTWPDGTPRLYISPDATVAAASINLSDGPVYIGPGATVMEGTLLRGPLAIGAHSVVRMGAKIYGGTTFGPWCKAGGEIDNSVLLGYSNKAHDGYLGNAVVGEWCNIGAGVNASNLKNDYSKIRIWNYRTHTFMRTELQFCGPIIGDHTKIGVNCMLNTATVLGVGVNIHGAGFPRVFVPSFSEGSSTTGFTSVPVKKFISIAERAISRRNLTVTESDIRIFEKVYEVASRFKG